MTLYSIVLFSHVAAALTLGSALTVDALILAQLRDVTTPSGTQPWLNLWSPVPRIAGGAGLVLLISGGYLTHQMSAWTLAWPKVAVLTLTLIGALGAMTSRRIRRLRRAINLRQPESLEWLEDPFLKTSLSVRIALVFAAVLLMNAKPRLSESLAIVGGSVLLGLAAAFVIPTRKSLLQPADCDARN
jgi:hypothetical protein